MFNIHQSSFLGPSAHLAAKSWPVALISAPFASLSSPSIQLGLLKAVAEQYGFPVTSFHLYLDFAKYISRSEYTKIADSGPLLVGEWLFSVEAFGDEAPDAAEALLSGRLSEYDKFLADPNLGPTRLSDMRRHIIPAYLNEVAASIDWREFKLVGFSSTFQQTTASIAFARRIKLANPDVVLVFGGANAEATMGLEIARSVELFDFVVSGEGDQTLPELLLSLTHGREVRQDAGIADSRAGRARLVQSQALNSDLDALPTPDYKEYFERAESLEILRPSDRRLVEIPFESARGCWWGAKQHCIFCGLNGGGMAFRSKSAERVLRELDELASRFGTFRFNAVDNIFDYRFFRSLLPQIEEQELDYDIFYEIKANLSRNELRRLRAGGVRRIQPGIESLSSRLLALMKKGVTSLQNINLLRWARYYKIETSWNFLWGFPGELVDDYKEQERILPFICHLEPPISWGRVLLERFSPMFSNSRAYGISAVAPANGYSFVYPRRFQLSDIAYFFQYELDGALSDDCYSPIVRILNSWSESWKSERPPRLVYWRASNSIQIEDSREGSTPRGTYTFGEPLKTVYLSCVERPSSLSAIHSKTPADIGLGALDEVLDYFCRLGLMIRDENEFLSLAIPATDSPR